MASIAGSHARIRIDNTITYVASQYEIDDTCESGDTTNFEGTMLPGGEAIFKERVATTAMARITVTKATYDPTDNPFAAPLNLTRGRTITLEIFPEKADMTTSHNFPEIVLTSVRHTGDVNGLQPVTFTGETNNSYSLAGE